MASPKPIIFSDPSTHLIGKLSTFMSTLGIQNRQIQYLRPNEVIQTKIKNSNSFQGQFMSLNIDQKQSERNKKDSYNQVDNSEMKIFLANHEQREHQQLKLIHLRRACLEFIENQQKQVADLSIVQLILDSNEQVSSKQKEEKNRIDSEEIVIKKYFAIKADENSLKTLVFKLVNGVLQVSQASYNSLFQAQFTHESTDLLRQTNKFKEEMQMLLYSDTYFRVTSVLLKICQFSRSRFFCELEKLQNALKKMQPIELLLQKQGMFQQQQQLLQQQKSQVRSRVLSKQVNKEQQEDGKRVQLNKEAIHTIYKQVFLSNLQKFKDKKQTNDEEDNEIIENKDTLKNQFGQGQQGKDNQNEGIYFLSSKNSQIKTKEQRQIWNISQANLKEVQQLTNKCSDLYFQSNELSNKPKRSSSIGTQSMNEMRSTTQDMKLKMISENLEKKKIVWGRNPTASNPQLSLKIKRETSKKEEDNFSNNNIIKNLQKLKSISFAAENVTNDNVSNQKANNDYGFQYSESLHLAQSVPNFAMNTASSTARILKNKVKRILKYEENLQKQGQDTYTPLSQLIPELSEEPTNNLTQEQQFLQILLRNQQVNYTCQTYFANTLSYHVQISSLLRGIFISSYPTCSQVQLPQNNFLFTIPSAKTSETQDPIVPDPQNQTIKSQQGQCINQKWVNLTFLSNLKQLFDPPNSRGANTKKKLKGNMKQSMIIMSKLTSPLSSKLPPTSKSVSRDCSPITYATPLSILQYNKDKQHQSIEEEQTHMSGVSIPFLQTALSKSLSQIPNDKAMQYQNLSGRIKKPRRISQKILFTKPLSAKKMPTTPLNKLISVPFSTKSSTLEEKNKFVKHINLQACQSPIQQILQRHSAQISQLNEIHNRNNNQKNINCQNSLTSSTSKLITEKSIILNQAEGAIFPSTVTLNEQQIHKQKLKQKQSQSQQEPIPFWRKLSTTFKEQKMFQQQQQQKQYQQQQQQQSQQQQEQQKQQQQLESQQQSI